MVDVDALVQKARQQLADTEKVAQEFLLADKLMEARFAPMSGPDWRDLIAKHPPRAGSVRDQTAGYNVDGVLPDYPGVELVVDGEVESILPKTWKSIVSALEPEDIKNLALAAWGLNEYRRAARIAAAGKASTGGEQKRPTSPEN